MARQIRKQIRKTRRAAFAALWVAALLALSAAPAFAHHKTDHANGGGNGNANAASDHDGDADSDSSTSYTEDNDTNDGGTPNNVADDGDNAHPSGKDRSVENGKSGNQGKSESNPDDSKGPMRHEGALGDDKANGPGGSDLADQDGNNGCGNDDDFDDDNNGWCGKKRTEETEVEEADVEADVIEDEVEGDVLVRTDRVLPKVIHEANVLGSRVDAATPVAKAAKVQGAVLPFTGVSDALTYLATGLSFMSIGAIALLYRSDNN